MEDIQARERDQLDPRHRLFDDDEAEIIAGAKPAAGLTSSERNIERAVLYLEDYLVNKNFQSIYEYLMNPNIPIDEVEQIANKLSNLYPQSYGEYLIGLNNNCNLNNNNLQRHTPSIPFACGVTTN
jgi:hypothetical protein